MTDLASGSLWLNGASFSDITPQNCNNLSSISCPSYSPPLLVLQLCVCRQCVWPYFQLWFFNFLTGLIQPIERDEAVMSPVSSFETSGHSWVLLACCCCGSNFFSHWISRLTLLQICPRQTGFSSCITDSVGVQQHLSLERSVCGWPGGCVGQKGLHIHMHVQTVGPRGGLDCSYYTVIAWGKQVLLNCWIFSYITMLYFPEANFFFF